MMELEDKAKWIRRKCIEMSYASKEGHLGSALSCVDILVALYEHFNLLHPSHTDRDRLYFSKGHACSALYATMAMYGVIPEDSLAYYTESGSAFTPHPDKTLLPMLEMSAGSLGHGLGIACGAAYALKLQGSSSKCIVLMGDGECNEGSVWEAAQFATAHKLDNLIVVVDYNKIQSIGRTDEISGGTELQDKFRAFGWDSFNIKGNDVQDIEWWIRTTDMPKTDMPLSFIAETTAGKGVSFMEDQVLWHYRVPSEDEVKRALEELV